jgi:NAD+ synthase (glutamine-hydrolysing)
MPAVRLALAQINPTVGDLAGNSELILKACKKAQEKSCQLIAFPELALTGYPIEDLALSRDFLEQSEKALSLLAQQLVGAGLGSLRVIIGHPGFAQNPTSWAIGQNMASVIFDGKIQQSYAKHHLPNYSVFDEYRVFVAGDEFVGFDLAGLRFSIVICEDIWQGGGPVSKISQNEVDVTLVLNGSPFEMQKTDTRLALVQELALSQNTAVCYLNLVGGQDDLVFDGNSFVVDSAGNEVARAQQFESELLIVEIETKAAIRSVLKLASPSSPIEQVWNALVLGTKDYVKKNGFSSVILGLSGGIDSAVCASIAVDALGKDRVFAVAMPSKYSSSHSLADAKQLSENTGLNYRVESIERYFTEFENTLGLEGLAAENLQARIRAVILMALSNKEGHLLLSTGNKTELAVGYSTIYGDSAGGFAPIKDVEKTLVWELARYRNQKALTLGQLPPIPESSITKPPSAELRPNQTDQDSLPDYEVLDRILSALIENRSSRADLIGAGFDATMVDSVIALVRKAEWKRRQGAIGPRITKLAFGRERRYPITNSQN